MERGEFEGTARDLVGSAGHPSYAGDGGRRVVARQTKTCRFERMDEACRRS
jgi:hypothetical protein